MFKSLFLLFAALVAVTSASSDASLRGSEQRELTFFLGGCAYNCPANSYVGQTYHRSLTFFLTSKCGYSWWLWSKSSCPCSFDDCVCSPGYVKLGGGCVYPSKPVPKPTPMPVPQPTPVPVAKPTPMPVATPYCQLEAIGGCDSCVCPPGTHKGAHVQCLDTLEDCFCNDTNDNANRNLRCILNY